MQKYTTFARQMSENFLLLSYDWSSLTYRCSTHDTGDPESVFDLHNDWLTSSHLIGCYNETGLRYNPIIPCYMLQIDSFKVCYLTLCSK